MPTSTDDDDAIVEWSDADATVVESDAVTQPVKTLDLPGYEVGRKDGCKACCLSCQEEVFTALIHVARAHGLEVSEIANLVAAVRQRIAPV